MTPIRELPLLAATAIYNAKSSHWSLKVVFSCLTYFYPVKELFHVLVFAVVLNLITGYWKNRKLYKEPLNSRKMRHTLEKIALYFGIFALTWMIEKEIIVYSEIYATKIVSLIIILAESKSVTENADAITGTKLFTGVFRSIYGIFRHKIGDDLPVEPTAEKPSETQNPQ